MILSNYQYLQIKNYAYERIVKHELIRTIV